MKGNIRDLIWPVPQIAALFGYALIEYPLGKPRRVLSLVYTILPIILQVWFYLYRNFCFTYDDQIFRRSVSDWLMNCCFIISVTCMCVTQWHGERYSRCLDEINQVDDTLMRLGLKNDSSSLRRAVVVATVTWIFWSFLLNTIDWIALAKLVELNSGFTVLTPVILNTSLHLQTVIDIHFSLLLGYAGTRFDCINNFLKELANDDYDTVGWFRLFRGSATIPVRKIFLLDERNTRVIWTTMHLHFRLMEVSREINRVLQVQISLVALFSYVYVLTCMIFTFRMILLPYEGDKVETITFIWVWSVGFFLKTIITNHVCESVSGKAASISDTTINLLRFMNDERMREDVSLIILQAKHKPLRFSSLGLSNFGYQYLYSMFASMVSMTVILLQFKTGLD